jgi:hypothetical protein
MVQNMTETTREEIETRLADLHRQRGVAALAGKPFRNELIVEQHEKLAMLEDAEAEQHRRDREAAAKNHQRECTRLLTEIKECEAAALNAKRDAEQCLRKAVAAQKLHLLHEASKRRAQSQLRQINGETGGGPLQNEMQLLHEQSRFWCAQLREITGTQNFGILKGLPSIVPSPDKSWT